MKENLKKNWKEIGMRTIWAQLAAFAAVLTVCGLGAALIGGGGLSEKWLDRLIVIALLTSTVTGAWIATAGMHNRLTEAAVFGICWYIALYLLGAILYGGNAEGGWVTLLLCVGSSIVVGLIKNYFRINRKEGRKRYKIKSFVHSAQTGK